jgi:hypothetical protein
MTLNPSVFRHRIALFKRVSSIISKNRIQRNYSILVADSSAKGTVKVVPSLKEVVSPLVPCSAPAGVIGQVCNWIDTIQLEDIPSKIQTKVKHLILDGLACAIVGAKLPWSRIATEAILDIEGEGQCTLVGWNKVSRSDPI